MAIIQISKIQQRSGNLVDLPQLDDAQFGWASDEKKLFIGKTQPNENIEVLTSYSNIEFSQIVGSEGNLNITAAANGEVLSYDGTNWVNKGATAGGLINLGTVGNVKLGGGAIGYVLETDGTGNLSWSPKGTISANIANATQANPVVITTAADNFFTDASLVTITGVSGMTQLNGNSYYANIITANSFSLYTDLGLTTPVNGTAYGAYTGNGRAIATVGGGAGGSSAGGSNTTIQFNNNNLLDGDADFTYNYNTNLLVLNGNANVGNLNATSSVTASRLISNIATGTAPFTVTSTTQVANLNVATAGLATYATTANGVAGANVSGEVAYAATANSVAGANVSGAVSYATTANSVAVANVSGIGNIATINQDGNASNILYGNGVFAPPPTPPTISYGDSNVATFLASYGSNTISTTGDVTAGNVSVGTGTVTAGTLTTGANVTAGSIIGTWTLGSGSTLNATYADLAEYYEADKRYDPTTVLEFGGDKEVTIASDGTARVAGVVSTNPAYAMNANCKGIAVAIALQGRVPTKVRGVVRKGDMMVSAGDGYARPSLSPQMGTVIGKALENFDGVEGVIEIAVGRL